MTITLDPTVLLNFYQAKTGQPLTGATTSTTTATTPSTYPTAPWNATSTSSTSSTTASTSSSSTAPSYSSVGSLVQSLLNGNTLIKPSAAQLSVSTTNASANSDYKNLFALYQGLTSLRSLASVASSPTTTPADLAQLQKAFSNGLNQVQSFINSGSFKQFQVGDGTVTASDASTVGAPEETDDYVTDLTASNVTTPVAALEGNVQFSMNVATTGGATTTVEFNLADMGSTPRSLNNVVSYLNNQLAAAGVATRFNEDVLSAGKAASTTTSSTGLTTTAAATAPSIALEIKGSALETISLSALDSTPSVYVGETSTAPSTGTTASTTTSSTSTTTTAATTTSQLVAFDPTGQNSPTSSDKVWTDNLPSGATVQSTATASDGSVYVLADVTSTINGQTIQGSQDAALLKYDSAGNLVYTRTLGAASSASGYSLAVSPDGTQVAVAGSVAGSLTPATGKAAASTTQQSFVTVYDAASGDELWDADQDATASNQANAVAFGADNTVYVAGTTSAALPGATSAGGQDGYLQQFSASKITDPLTGAQSYAVTSGTSQEFGTTGVDRATGIAVSGSSIYVSSVENGDAVVRDYSASGGGAPTLAAKQDLGNLQGGNLSGIAVQANGSVLVAGSTHNGALNAGAVANAYTSGENAFVAQLSSNLDPAGGEDVAYLSNGQDRTATALTISGGNVYIAGQTATGNSASSGLITQTGYAAEVDPATGQVAWSKSFQGANGNAEPTAIAVSANGSSSLDALGLPQGTIDYTTSNTLVANTSLRVGDSFSIQVGGGAATAVAIAAGDTFSSLAQKIEKASGYQVTATTTTGANGQQEIKITPQSTTSATRVAVEAGPAGANALGPLGLQAGLITNASPITAATTTSSNTASASNLKAAYTVNVPTTLSLATPAGVTAATHQLATAIAEVQTIYSNMTTKSSTATGSSSANSGLVSYYNTQAANYSTALERLTSGESTTTSTTGTLGSLIAGIL